MQHTLLTRSKHKPNFSHLAKRPLTSNRFGVILPASAPTTGHQAAKQSKKKPCKKYKPDFLLDEYRVEKLKIA